MPGGIITFLGVLVVLFIVFKVFSLSMKLFIKLLINAILGAVVLTVFNFFGDALFSFSLDINWLTALITGILGLPGVVLLVILKLLA